MTKKDYVIIADVLRASSASQLTIEMMAVAFKNENKLFKKQVFVAACKGIKLVK